MTIGDKIELALWQAVRLAACLAICLQIAIIYLITIL
jgi:hypothetical protein